MPHGGQPPQPGMDLLKISIVHLDGYRRINEGGVELEGNLCCLWCDLAVQEPRVHIETNEQDTWISG